jgi:hypothetical protein
VKNNDQPIIQTQTSHRLKMTETAQNHEDQEEQNEIEYPTVDSSHVALDMELYRFSLNGEDIILHD